MNSPHNDTSQQIEDIDNAAEILLSLPPEAWAELKNPLTRASRLRKYLSRSQYETLEDFGLSIMKVKNPILYKITKIIQRWGGR